MLPEGKPRHHLTRPRLCQLAEFLPSRYAGIAVLRLPRKPSHEDLLNAVRTLAAGLEREELAGKLWIIEAGRIRVFQEGQN